MTLSEEKNGKVFVLGLSGKLDITDIAYINSSGLRGLLLVAKQLASCGGKLILAGVSEPNQKVLVISGLTSIFTLRPTKAEALGSFPQ